TPSLDLSLDRWSAEKSNSLKLIRQVIMLYLGRNIGPTIRNWPLLNVPTSNLLLSAYTLQPKCLLTYRLFPARQSSRLQAPHEADFTSNCSSDGIICVVVTTLPAIRTRKQPHHRSSTFFEL